MDKAHLQRGKAATYHSHDFEFDSVVPEGGLASYLDSLEAAQSSEPKAPAAATAAAASSSSAHNSTSAPKHAASEQQAHDWDAFHSKTNGRFFKPRMFLLLEFPQLCSLGAAPVPPAVASAGGRTDAASAMQQSTGIHGVALPAVCSGSTRTRLPAVWEVGCGAGSNVLPLLHHTEHKLRVFASDYSPAAVQALSEHDDFDHSRCSAFVLDVVQGSLLTACTEAAHEYPEGVQGVTATFLLSAIHPSEQAEAMRNLAAALSPGGLLCFRDYGIFDHAMMRFKPDALQQGGACGALFRRADGTLAHYFALVSRITAEERTWRVRADDVRQLCEGAGLQVLELEYACVLNRNRKKGTEMRRVFVHALAQKPQG